ncbi:MAG TPA: aspartate kinase [Spirochaetota bacterium]|nr:aspartate kinase [Spirochaetota bacterium]HPJ36338.1 aspartate kinase [Spirochaetota bacterium]
MKVFKFGGASVKDADSVKNVFKVLDIYREEKIAVVISAMGKTTNALERLLHAYYYGTDSLEEEFETLYNYHFRIVEELFVETDHEIYGDIEEIFQSLKTRISSPHSDNYDYEYDQIVSIGEIISTKIVSAYLNMAGMENIWVDARAIIRTDNTYRDARVDWDKTDELVKDSMPFHRERVYITQGFIGATSENISTTLGREGSDFSAAILAWCLDAEKVAIWKDVPGVLNADPKYFDNTIKLDQLSYHDAIELAYYGASVIHPKTIKPLQNKKIPLWVKSFVEPKEKGTVIQSDREGLAVPSFIFKMNQALVTIAARDFSFIAEQNLRDIFHELSRLRIKINLMQNTALSFSVCADWDERKIPELMKALGDEFMIKYNRGLELVTIRHYDQETIERVTVNKEILLEEKSRYTVQMVMRDLDCIIE